jgi:hypothetical protein
MVPAVVSVPFSGMCLLGGCLFEEAAFGSHWWLFSLFLPFLIRLHCGNFYYYGMIGMITLMNELPRSFRFSHQALGKGASRMEWLRQSLPKCILCRQLSPRPQAF